MQPSSESVENECLILAHSFQFPEFIGIAELRKERVEQRKPTQRRHIGIKSVRPLMVDNPDSGIDNTAHRDNFRLGRELRIPGPGILWTTKQEMSLSIIVHWQKLKKTRRNLPKSPATLPACSMRNKRT